MGLLDGLGNLLFGSKKAPAYRPAPFAAARPQYQVDANDPTDELARVFRERISQPGYLPQGFEEALLGQAQRGVQDDTQRAQGAVSERLNRMNLLGSSAQGRAFGEIGAQGQRSMTDARDNLTQARLGSYQNTLALGQQVANGLADRAAKRYAADLDSYNSRMGDYLREHDSQVRQYEDRANRNQGILSGLFGIGGYALGRRR